MPTQRSNAVNTPAGIWNAFVSNAGLDLKRYDKEVEDRVRATLALQPGPMTTALRLAARQGLTVARVVGAVLKTMEPWSQMFGDLLAVKRQ
jgi:hypothetical protein